MRFAILYGFFMVATAMQPSFDMDNNKLALLLTIVAAMDFTEFIVNVIRKAEKD